jgi:GTPase KRas protein
MTQTVEEMKIAVVGGGGVGKSAITIQFVQNEFVAFYDPTIEDSYRKSFRVGECMILAEILDTAGQEEYKALRDSYMRQMDGFLCVYSIIDKKSFEEIRDDFVEHIRRIKDADQFPCVLYGNKNDLESERMIKTQDVKEYADRIGAAFYEGSAKRRLHVEDAFYSLVQKIRAERAKKNILLQGPIVKKKKCTLV